MLKEQEQVRMCAGSKAREYFENGFHCAEAVASAVLESFGKDGREAAAHATAFGGGMGRSFKEACGAMTGGIIAIGHMHGRREPGGSWDLAAELGEVLRHTFVKRFGCTTCAVLRERFGQEKQHEECAELVRQTASLTRKTLLEKRTGEQALDCDRDCCG